MSTNKNFVLKIIQKGQIGKIENEFIKICFYKGNNFYWIVKYVHLKMHIFNNPIEIITLIQTFL